MVAHDFKVFDHFVEHNFELSIHLAAHCKEVSCCFVAHDFCSIQSVVAFDVKYSIILSCITLKYIYYVAKDDSKLHVTNHLCVCDFKVSNHVAANNFNESNHSVFVFAWFSLYDIDVFIYLMCINRYCYLWTIRWLPIWFHNNA